jgi:hypothetical protein
MSYPKTLASGFAFATAGGCVGRLLTRNQSETAKAVAVVVVVPITLEAWVRVCGRFSWWPKDWPR